MDKRPRKTHQRNRGAVLLARTGEPQPRIAAKTGITREEVSYYSTGQRIPGPVNRRRFLDKYKIPIKAWDEEADELTEVDWSSGEDETLVQVAKIRADALADKHTTPGEKLDVVRKANAIEREHREAQAVDEKRIADSPSAAKVAAKIVRALEPFGAKAMVAAAEALKDGGNE